jgi:uncharacterized iron-regulated membrane protein
MSGAVAEYEQWRAAKESLAGLESNITRLTFGDKSHSFRVGFSSGNVWYFIPGQAQPFFKSSSTASENVVRFLSDLHRGKFLGASGRYAFTLMGGLAIVYLLTGVALLKQRAAKQRQRKLHRVLGWLLIVPLLTLILSGSTLNVASELRSVPLSTRSSQVSNRTSDDWDAALVVARARDANNKISLVAKVGTFLMTEFTNGRRIYSVGRLVHIDNSPWTAAGWFEAAYPIHSGRYWGLSGRLIQFITALGSLVLVISGLWLRRPGPGKSK